MRRQGDKDEGGFVIHISWISSISDIKWKDELKAWALHTPVLMALLVLKNVN